MSNSAAQALDETSEAPACFVIMPISDQADYRPGHFGRVYEDIIGPAVEQAGFKPLRADQDRAANLIHLQILEQLLSAPMAVCDLSSLNPNVMFELGLRQAFDKPVVLLKDGRTRNPFDTSLIRYVEYDESMFYREVKTAIEAIAGAIIATNPENGSAGVNSIIRLLGLQAAAVKGSNAAPADARFALLEQKLTDISMDLRSLKEKAPPAPQQRIDPTLAGTSFAPPGYFDSAVAAAARQGINLDSPRSHYLRGRPTVTEQARAAEIDPVNLATSSDPTVFASLFPREKPSSES